MDAVSLVWYVREHGIAHRAEVKEVGFGISEVKLQDKSNTISRPKIGTTDTCLQRHFRMAEQIGSRLTSTASP